MRQRLGEEERIPKVMCNLATALSLRGALAEAEELYRECHRRREEIFGPEDLDLAASLRSLGRRPTAERRRAIAAGSCSCRRSAR